ncbi:DUF4625 domain-containing protein [Empedobacter sedimenti]|uniref:DUF4625 domain-containing protein n=1 Tax=Empedobacter sedimenti TaxID=3042610 RepID=UPI0024A69D37|nr:DUF4625 domain-containing protein [Empedobacter sedimenti]
MKNSILKYTFITLSALFISSCSSDDSTLDTTKPEINLISPKDDAHLHLGDDINIEAILKDNVELGAVKIDIHFAGDGHHHKTADVQWEFTKQEAIPAGKKEHAFNYKVAIPKEGIVDGHYHLGIILIDKAGNQSEAYIEIDIVDHAH